jgi:uncharacterized membrane protein YfcA
MTGAKALLGVLVGLGAGVLSGLFGVGGGTVMTPGIQVLLGTAPIVALATPLPAIFPTAVTGAITYGRESQVDARAAGWMAGAGLLGAVGGAALTDVVNTHLLLALTAGLLAYESGRIIRARRVVGSVARALPALSLALVGVIAGFVSGLLGIGGGLVMVPLLSGRLGMPLKQALGTSLLAMTALVIPGTIVHAVLGHVDWAIVAALIVGSVPGALIGAKLALGVRERTLRVLVGSFLLVVAVAYGASELTNLLRS